MSRCRDRQRGVLAPWLLCLVLLFHGCLAAAALSEAAAGEGGEPVVLALELMSASGGKQLPFTAGQPLREGQVPRGSSLVAAELPNLQFVVKNRWPDGSAKFAILSGLADLKAGEWRKLKLRIASQTTPDVPIGTASLRSSGLTASVRFGELGAASWSGHDWDNPVQEWVSGPLMSAWTYRKPIGSDAHLVAWLEVRSYRGGHIEVLPWIENGYLTVPQPGERSGTATFVLSGTERFSQPLTLLNHQRAVLAGPTELTHWQLADPQITPAHDTAYFMATRLVPHYSAATGFASMLFKRLPIEYTPLMLASHSPGMGMTGYHSSIGLLPEWDVAYLSTRADPRAYRSVLINAMASGRYGIHYRDERTNRPLAFSSHPHLVMSPGSGVPHIGTSSKNIVTPATTGAWAPSFATSHHPSLGYMAYLLSGWYYFLEECQFVATANFLKQGDVNRQQTKGIMLSHSQALSTRGAAWALRTLAQAAAITPDDDRLRAELVGSVEANIVYYHERYVLRPSNPLGLVQPISNFRPGDPWLFQIWMDDFFTAAFGYLKDLKLHARALQPALDAFTEWKYRSVVGRLGAGGFDEFPYPYGAQYLVPYAPTARADWNGGSGPWYASWGEVARAMGLPLTVEPGSPMASGYPAVPSGYWGNLMPALAYAVDHGAKGADQAWQRVRSMSNYPALARAFNDVPVWSVAPR